jgi:hypothetical protein
MALSGIFQADFSPFTAAVDGAVIKLRDIESGAAKVSTSVSRIAESFSGSKVIQQATMMAEVFDRAGGAAKFTDAELARMGATGAEAAAKLRALGQDVPPGIQRIADEAKNADTQHRSLGATVKDLALGFAAMFTARAAFNFVADVIADASALKDLSQQTHINVEELQLLAGGMSEFGVDADQLGRGLFKLSRGIAGGDESVVRGLHMMGLSLKDVEGLQGQELFLKIERGLATLQGGLRDTAAAELYGGKLGAAMAGAAEGIDGALESWQRLNHVTTTESIDAMDRYDESIKRAKKSLSAMAADMIGPVAEGFNVLVDAAQRGASKWSLAMGLLPKGLGGIGTGAEGLTKIIDELNQKTEANAKATATATGAHAAAGAALTAQGQAAKFMAALEADAAQKLDADQLKNLAHLKEIGALNAANAASIGVNASQFAAYTAAQEKAKTATAALAVEHKKFADAVAVVDQAGKGWQGTLDTINGSVVEEMRALTAAGVPMDALLTYFGLGVTQGNAFTKMLKEEADQLALNNKIASDSVTNWATYFRDVAAMAGTGVKAQIAETQRWLEDQIAKHVLAKTDTADFYNYVYAQADLTNQKINKSALEGDAHSREHFAKLATDAQAAYDFATAHAGSFTQEWIQELQEMATAAQASADNFGTAFDGAFDKVTAHAQQASTQVATSWAAAMTAVQDGQGTLSGTIQNAAWTDQRRQDTQKAWNENRYFGPVVNSSKDKPRGTGPDWDIIIPKAAGGPVNRGGSYLVGEEGPELFIPASNGSIAAHGGGGTVVTNIFHVNGTGEEVARKVMAEITRTMRVGRKWPAN